MTVIQADDLTKEYDAQTGVSNVTLTVREGSICGLVGPNGSGKTTVLEMMAGLVRPTAGTVIVLGNQVWAGDGLPAKRVGVVFEGLRVYDELTGREHIAFMEQATGKPRDARDYLGDVGLAAAADDPAGTYSGGMAQRLGLAMALVGDPDLLLLDEPFRALDTDTRDTIERIVRKRRDRGKTVVMATHHFEYVERLCDEVCVLADGAVAMTGPLDQLSGQSTRLMLSLRNGQGDLRSILDQFGAGVDAEVSANGATVTVQGTIENCYTALEAVADSTPESASLHLAHPSLANVAEPNPGEYT